LFWFSSTSRGIVKKNTTTMHRTNKVIWTDRRRTSPPRVRMRLRISSVAAGLAPSSARVLERPVHLPQERRGGRGKPRLYRAVSLGGGFFRQRSQRLAKEQVKTLRTFAAPRRQERLLRRYPRIAEIDQGGNDIFLDRAGLRRAHRSVGRSGSGQLVAQFQHHALGRLPADSWNARKPRQVAAANRAHHLVGGHAAQDLDRERWTDPAHGQQLLEELLFGQTQESVQAERVFANMGVDVERDVGACRGHFRERRHADRNVIADSVRFHDRLVRTLRQQRSSKMRNHLSIVPGVLYGRPPAFPPRAAPIKYTFSFPFHRRSE